MRTANLLLVCSLVGLLTTPVSAQAKGGLGAVFGGLIGAAVGKAVGKAIATPESIEQALRKMSDQVNKQMPKVIDRDTRLDNIVAGPGARFSYNYTITSASSRDVDRPALLKFLNETMKPKVCANPDLEVFFKNGVTIGYLYRGSDNGFVGKVEVTPRDCGVVT